MTFDELQQEWKLSDHRPTTTIDTELLAQMIKRNYREVEESYWQQSLRGFLLGIFFVGLFLWIKLYFEQYEGYWPYLLAIAWLGVFVPFAIVDGLIRRYRRPKLDDSIQSYLHCSIFQIDYQIWWVKHFLWFFALPMILYCAAFVVLCFVFGEMRNASSFILSIGFSLVVSAYLTKRKLEQSVNEKSLPKREELKSLLDSLSQ